MDFVQTWSMSFIYATLIPDDFVIVDKYPMLETNHESFARVELHTHHHSVRWSG